MPPPSPPHQARLLIHYHCGSTVVGAMGEVQEYEQLMLLSITDFITPFSSMLVCPQMQEYVESRVRVVTPWLHTHWLLRPHSMSQRGNTGHAITRLDHTATHSFVHRLLDICECNVTAITAAVEKHSEQRRITATQQGCHAPMSLLY